MIECKPLSVSLTPELHAFVGSLVKMGNYTSSSEVVRAGLRLLQQQQVEQARRVTPRAVPAKGGR